MTTDFNGNINFNANPKTTASKQVDKENIVSAGVNAGEKLQSEGVPMGQSAIVGQSQIKADNIAKDLATFKANPKLIQVADGFFDKAYAQLLASNDPYAYEKACLMTSEFVNECAK